MALSDKLAENKNQVSLFGGEPKAEAPKLNTVFGPRKVDLGTEFNDPRPDLAETYNDGFLWLNLLALAYRKNPLLSGLLHGFRCQGTKIERKGTGFVLRPVIGKQAWPTSHQYEQDRDYYLRPHVEDIKILMKELFEWEDEK